MAKYFLMIFLLTTATNLTNCGGVKDDLKPPPLNNTTFLYLNKGYRNLQISEGTIVHFVL